MPKHSAFLKRKDGPANTDHLLWHRDNAHQDLQRDALGPRDGYREIEKRFQSHNAKKKELPEGGSYA